MGKYNNIESIPIDSIPKEELEIAIKEWAEGDRSMENLLWTCHEKGIKTCGCHAGSRPYIEFLYQDGINKISCLLDTLPIIRGMQIVAMVDGGNPFSGTEWFVPSISIVFSTKSKTETDKYLNIITDTLNKYSNEKKSNPVLDLLSFFINKETGLNVRFKHTIDNTYEFILTHSGLSLKRHDYYHEVFTKAGLKGIPSSFDNHQMRSWIIESNDFDEILIKLENAKDIIINEYSLEPETNEKDIVSFQLLARFKKANMTKDEFEKWLKEEKEKMLKSSC